MVMETMEIDENSCDRCGKPYSYLERVHGVCVTPGRHVNGIYSWSDGVELSMNLCAHCWHDVKDAIFWGRRSRLNESRG